METQIRLLVVDDDTQVRRGLRMHLAGEPDIELVGEAIDAGSAVRLAQELHPDIVLMDLLLPLPDGIQATHNIRTVAPTSAVIAISVRDEASIRQAVLAAGAAAFVSKQEGPELLLATIREIARRSRDGETETSVQA